MANFKIYNVIFYNKLLDGKVVKKSIIIHNNGVIIRNDYNRGIDAVYQLLKEKGIDTKKGFKELINKEFIYVLAEEQVKRDIKKYVPTPEEKATYKFMEDPRKKSSEPKAYEKPPVFVPKQEEKDEEEPLICRVMSEVNNSKPLKKDEEKVQIDEFYEDFDDSFKIESEIDLDIPKTKSIRNK